MQIKLMSDFHDYYDHQFDLNGFEFERLSKSGPDRIEMFELLENLDFVTPRHGFVYDLAREFDNQKNVVVYSDLNAHRGEGKIKTTLSEALSRYQHCYASEFIGNGGISFRYLKIGKRAFWLDYANTSGDWRSNYGGEWNDIWIQVSEEVKEEDQFRLENLNYPMFAIDFVKGNDRLLAIDFNISPSLKGTGIEEVLTPTEVVDLIKEEFLRQQKMIDNEG